jgi:hypothetical protein
MADVIDHEVFRYRTDPALVGQHMGELRVDVVVRLEAAVAVLLVDVTGPHPVVLGLAHPLIELVVVARAPAIHQAKKPS